MPIIYIDNKPYEVKEGQNLLHACLSLGFDIPYFCWHPAFHSVGACRQCAVKQFKDEKDTQGKIVMSCMTPAADGARISIDDPEARAFRAGIIELLMLNHPHDCPVCDEGGECHLQDMTVMTGHAYRKSRFKKRTHRNQYLGPFINHEMNRCIQCYRCVRFYSEYAGGRDLGVFASHHHVYFGRHEDGALESGFSGNLVEVCPTGVFTDKTLKKHYTRKWDLQTAPSICVHCGVGCNTIPGERYGKLRRILNRYNSEVNGYFLCDRGRFGYEFVNSEERIRKPLLRSGGYHGKEEPSLGIAGREETVKRLETLLYFGARVIGIGSPRASVEANYLLKKLVGPGNFYSGLSENDHRFISAIIEIMRKGPARSPSLHDIQSSDAVFILGEDVAASSPMMALALRRSVLQGPMHLASGLRIPEWQNDAVREAIQDRRGPLFIAASHNSRLDDIASHVYFAAPDDIARLGFAVVHELDQDAPHVKGIAKDLLARAQEIASALKNARRPLIISGTGCGSEAVIHAAANVAWSLCRTGTESQLCYVTPECNTLGLGLLAEEGSGGGIEEAFRAIDRGNADTAIILENDIFRRSERSSVEKFLKGIKHLIVIDHLVNETVSGAEVVLPAAAFAEASGTLVNNEGRAQRYYRVFAPDDDIQESWRWLRDMMSIAGLPEADNFGSLDEVISSIAREVPVFMPLPDIAPPAGFRITGKKIPRQPHRYSGRTAMTVDISVHEPRPQDDPDSPLSFSMEGYEGRPPSSLIARFWAPGWNSVQALNKFQREVGGPLCGGDPGKRLLEPLKSGETAYFGNVPHAFGPREGEILFVPIYHIFGSEELSVFSAGIVERAERPYLALNKEVASGIDKREGEKVDLSIAGSVFSLPLKIIPSLPSGVAGIPSGLPGLTGIISPVWGKILSPKKEDML